MPKDISGDHVSSEDFVRPNDDGSGVNDRGRPERISASFDPADAAATTTEMSHYWAVFLFRGLLVTGFGLYFLIQPASSIEVLVKVFGSLFILEGAMNGFKCLYILCLTPTFDMMGVYFVYFAVNMAIGIFIIAHPDTTKSFFLGALAAYFLFVGILQCLFACILRSSSDMPTGTEVFLAFTGILYMILGIVVATHIDSTSNLLMRIVGVLLTLSGIQLLLMGFQLRSRAIAEKEEGNNEIDASRTELSSLV